MRILERLLMLRVIDNYWIDHLTSMDNMRQGISVQAIGQDPLPLYKREGHTLFELMMSSIRHDIVHNIFNITVTKTPPPKQTASPMAKVAAETTPAPAAAVRNINIVAEGDCDESIK